MSPSVTRWDLLRLEIDAARAVDRTALRIHRQALVGLLREATRHRVCAPETAAWLRTSRRRKAAQLAWSANADGRAGRHPAVRLNGLRWLEDGALLTLVVTLTPTLHYSVGIRGVLRTVDQPWYARIDLDTEQKGSGPCAHPLLHCHVGRNPDDAAEQSVRAPLPWLTPADATRWLLATVEPELFEPASVQRQ